MAKYKYSALKNNNNIINGEIEASNPREAREKIRELGFLPTKIYLEQSNEINQNVDFDVDTKNVQINVSRLSLQEKIMFTSELEVLLSSGIPIIEALQSIANNTPKQKIKTVCEKIKDGILSGMTFAQGTCKNRRKCWRVRCNFKSNAFIAKEARQDKRTDNKCINISSYFDYYNVWFISVIFKSCFPCFYGSVCV